MEESVHGCNHDGPGLNPGRWPFDASPLQRSHRGSCSRRGSWKLSCQKRAADSCESSWKIFSQLAGCRGCIFISAEGQECRVTSAATDTKSPLKLKPARQYLSTFIFDFWICASSCFCSLEIICKNVSSSNAQTRLTPILKSTYPLCSAC